MRKAVVGWMLGLALSVVATRSAHAGGEIPFSFSDDPSVDLSNRYSESPTVHTPGTVTGVLGGLQIGPLRADGTSVAVPQYVRFSSGADALGLRLGVPYPATQVFGPGFVLQAGHVVAANWGMVFRDPMLLNCDFSVRFNSPSGFFWYSVTSLGGIASHIEYVQINGLFHRQFGAFVGPGGTWIVPPNRPPIMNASGFAGATYGFVDTTPPVLHLQDITVEATSPAGAVATWGVPLFSDDSGVAPLETCSHIPGTNFPLGQTTVTCAAVDASGNVATGSFTVTVQDTTPPEFLDARDTSVTVLMDPAEAGSLQVVRLRAAVFDLCDPDPYTARMRITGFDRQGAVVGLSIGYGDEEADDVLEVELERQVGVRWVVEVIVRDHSFNTQVGARKRFIIQFESSRQPRRRSSGLTLQPGAEPISVSG